jgi:hypothetical protein
MSLMDRFLPAPAVLVALTVAASSAFAADAPASRPVPVPLKSVKIEDACWSPKLAIWRTTTIKKCPDRDSVDSPWPAAGNPRWSC